MSETDKEDVLESAVEDGFRVHDAASANWVIRRIVEARQYAARVEAWAEAELRRAKREEQFFLFRFGAELEQWVRSATETGRRKSISLPAGRLGFRSQPAHLRIVDEVRLLTWCKLQLPAAVIIQERISKSAIMGYITQTGECPDGAELAAGTDRFFVG